MHDDSSHAAWQQRVGKNINVQASKHHVGRPGSHIVKFWRVDPGVLLQKLIVNTGGLRPSYLGPPESPYLPASSTEPHTETAMRPRPTPNGN